MSSYIRIHANGWSKIGHGCFTTVVFICLSYLVANFLCKTGLGKCHSIQFWWTLEEIQDEKKNVWVEKKHVKRPFWWRRPKNEEQKKIVKVKTSKMTLLLTRRGKVKENLDKQNIGKDANIEKTSLNEVNIFFWYRNSQTKYLSVEIVYKKFCSSSNG